MQKTTYLRKAQADDLELLYQWANDPDVRKNSFQQHFIPFEEHKKWFFSKLESIDTDIYIYCSDSCPIGQIRFDYEEDTARLSYSIEKRFRGQGHAPAMLRLAEHELKQNKAAILKISAEVKQDNTASIKKFRQLDYSEQSDSARQIKIFTKTMKSLQEHKKQEEEPMYIPYGTQFIEEDDMEAVFNVLKSDYLTTGPNVAEFEKQFAACVNAKYAVAVSNGTAALHAACHAAGIKEGDEVITTPITFTASANSILYCGAVPVFADIKPDTYNIDPADIERKITEKTKAIIPVHYTGQPCEMDKIHKIAKKYHLTVIEDAAHALGADYQGKKIGTLSDMTAFSFHPVKHITTGEGGMITTNNKELYKSLKLFTSHGITRNPELMSANDGDWYYQQLDLGYNYRITDIQCALGISQLKKLDRFVKRRREIAKQYTEAFSGTKEILTPYQEAGCNNSWHLYVIQVNHRKELFDSLRRKQIGVNVHYIPVYHHPYYQENGYKETCCRHAEELYKHIISLPIHPKLTDKEQTYVINAVKEFVK